MSGAPAATDISFESVPDEETELRALVRSLQMAEGFSLFFVRCNQYDLRQRIVTALREQLPELHIEEIHFTEPITHLLDALRWHFDRPPSGAVFVSGLEYSLPKADEAHATPFVANLNAARNSFPIHIPCPLVLWVPDYVITAILRGAPDFYSVRSGTYHFHATPTNTPTTVTSLTHGEVWQIDNLPLDEKLERIDAIESLLAGYRALPSDQGDPRAESRLLNRLGNLYLAIGRWQAAEECYQQDLAICRKIGDRVSEGQTLNNLGNVYQSRGRWQEAEEAYQQSLEIKRNVSDPVGEGTTLNNLGEIYRRQGRWAEAETVFQQSIKMKQEFGDRMGEGQTLNNLGIVYEAQGRLVEAEAAFQQSIEIKQELGDRMGEGQTLNNLGNVYQVQGRWIEAERACQESLEIKRKFGDRVGEGHTLANMALLLEAQGDIPGALNLARQALQVLETTEDEAGKAEVRGLIEEWEGRNATISTSSEDSE